MDEDIVIVMFEKLLLHGIDDGRNSLFDTVYRRNVWVPCRPVSIL